MELGIHLGIPEEDYHALGYVSNSYLSRLNKCPAAAKVPMEETPTLLLGRAVHSYVLEGDAVFFERFVVAPECDRRTIVGKEAWANFIEESDGKTPITQKDFINIYQMNESVRAHPFAAELLADGIAETTAIWKDKKTGITCKCRPDWTTSEGNFLVDLKTTKDSGEYGFGKSVSTYRYFQQNSFYKKGYEIASGTKVEAFVFIAVEKEFPFRTEIYTLDSDYVEWGDAEVARLMQIEADCRRKGHYNHFVNSGCGTIMLPGYINR